MLFVFTATCLYSPPQVVTLSAPCPPWSRASRQGGLQTADGRLLLRVSRLVGLLETPVVLLEQVEGFCFHDDYGTIMRSFQEGGFDLLWRATHDLAELLPGSRRQHLMLFRNRKLAHLQQVVHCAWHQAVLPTLEQAGVLFESPWPILKAAVLPQETLDMYMDPAFLPPRRGSASRQQSPAVFRLRGPSDQASCFMAQYGQQHCLPSQFLQDRGLLGCLFCHADRPRFFTPP